MIRKFIIFSVLVVSVGMFVTFFASGLANATPMIFADSQNLACDGATLVSGGDCDNTTGSAVPDLVASITSIFAWVLGILAVIFIIYGGFKYMTSTGDSSKVGAAKSTILFAIIGLVIAVVAQPLVKYVIEYFS